MRNWTRQSSEPRGSLYAARAKRIWPGRDEKVLTSWNGMMLRAFAEASRTFGRADYREVATKNAEFLLTRLRQNGRLLHVHKDGQAKIEGFLEDYANLIDGLVSLYEATFERRWLDEAIDLSDVMIQEFGDEERGGFFDTAVSAERLVSRPRDLQDGATPSGNAVAVSVLLRLAQFTGRRELETRAVEVLKSLAEPMAEQPLGFGRYLSAVDYYTSTHREIAIAGRRGDSTVDELAGAVYKQFEPNAIMGFVDVNEESSGSGLPFLEHRPMQQGKATAYLCEHYTCMPPVFDADALSRLLLQGTGVVWQEF